MFGRFLQVDLYLSRVLLSFKCMGERRRHFSGERLVLGNFNYI